MTRGCSWWRTPAGWELDDPDLKALRDSPLRYAPGVLEDVVPDGLYVLRGPRRVGKSVEVKRAIASLIHRGVQPRRIIHYACDTLSPGALRQLERVGRNLATAGLEGPRYWFLDEITAVGEWPTEIKWLRDNTEMREDCVVLTGSSSHDLDLARNELAGRRGTAQPSDRLLLPMSFRSFCRQFRHSGLPQVPVIRPCDFLSEQGIEAAAELLPWIDDLVSMWEVYCGCGGFPQAVESQLEQADVDPSFIQALFDIVYGDAFKRANLTAAQVLHLLNELSKGLASPINMSHLARTTGMSDHKLASRRIQDLIANYIVWPCHKQGQQLFPNLAAQSKLYFTDPLLARLAHGREARLIDPDLSKLGEQQIGQHLARHATAGDPGAYSNFTNVMYTQSPSRKQIDFVGPASAPLGFEVKYADVRLEQESATLRATPGGGVLATRAVLGASSEERVRFVPAAFVAFLLAA